MCEGTVFLVSGGNEEEVMKDVLFLEARENRFVLIDLLGNRKELQAKIKNIDFMHHKVVLEEI